MVALRPNPNDTVSATTLANCRPSPIDQPQQGSREHDRKYSRQDACQHDYDGSEDQTDESGDKQKLKRQASVQFLDHQGAVAGGNRRQAGHGDLVARMLHTYLI